MKDHVIAVLEALRVARLELRTHESGGQSDSQTLERLKDVLFDQRTTRALVVLGAMDDAPSVIPAQDGGKHHPLMTMKTARSLS